MLHIIFMVLGVAVGAAASGEAGVLLGLFTGIALAEVMRLGKLARLHAAELASMRQQVSGLTAKLADINAGKPIPSAAGNAGASLDAGNGSRPEIPGETEFDLDLPADFQTGLAGFESPASESGDSVTASFRTDTSAAPGNDAPFVLADGAGQSNPDTALAQAAARPVSVTQAASAPHAPAARPRPAQKEPSSAEALFNRFMVQTNWVTRIGLIILFFGVAFLLKFAAQHVSVSMPIRLSGIGLGSMVAFFMGWRLLDKRRGYGLLLQGGGVGVAFMDVYAAMHLYHLITPAVGFFLLLLVSVVAALGSVIQNAMVLAVFGILGGFLAPVLASSGDGSHVMLFSYYAILNAGIVAIVWFRAWRPLTLLGFAFTFVIGVFWGVTEYHHDLFASTEPFLLLFWGFYLLIAVLFAWHKRWDYRAVLDGPIVFGTPAIGLVLQHALVSDYAYGMAWSTLGIGLLYLALAAFYQFRLLQRDLMSESLWAIGIVILSLTIPFAFDDDLTATFWALEGVGGLWLAVRQQRPWGIALALLAQVGAGVSWAVDDLREAGQHLFLNAACFNGALVALAGLLSAWILKRGQVRVFGFAPEPVVLAWGMVWWLGVGLWQLSEHLTDRQFAPALMLFFSVTAVAMQGLGNRFNWQALLYYLAGFTPAYALAALSAVLGEMHRPSAYLGWLAWPVGFGLHLWLLQGLFQRWGKKGYMSLWHGAGLLLALGLLSWEIVERVHGWTHLLTWQWMGLGLASLMLLWAVRKARAWAAAFDPVYRQYMAGLLAFLLLINVLVCNFLQPDLSPMHYFPLLNALDIWQAACIASVFLWWRNQPEQVQARWQRLAFGVLGGSVFLLLNAVLLRTLHRFWLVSYSGHGLFHSDLVQTCIAIFWALLGILLMLRASKIVSRLLWAVGCALLGVVVLKLFLVDLANTGTVARIVSFMGVGGLLLAVGYFVPLPAVDETPATGDRHSPR